MRSTLGWLLLTKDVSSLKLSSTCRVLQGMLLPSVQGAFPRAWLLRVLDLVLRKERGAAQNQLSVVPISLGVFFMASSEQRFVIALCAMGKDL